MFSIITRCHKMSCRMLSTTLASRGYVGMRFQTPQRRIRETIPFANRLALDGMATKSALFQSFSSKAVDAPVDVMDRYPSFTSGGILRGLDYAGTALFAFTGTIKAGYAQMDLLGCLLVGLTTAMGGGTFRDLLLGNVPVFWMQEWEYLCLAGIASLATFFLWPSLRDYLNLNTEETDIIQVGDAICLGAFACIGTMNAVRLGMHPVVCAMCGMMTATFGGLVRDVLCQEKPWILHSHSGLYATTALAGAVTYVTAAKANLPVTARILLGGFTVVSARYLSRTYDIKLPQFAQIENTKSQ